MKNCKEVSTFLSVGDVGHPRLSDRVGVWMHLAVCRHCRAFRRQLMAMRRAMRLAGATAEAEPGESFEREIIERLRK